MSDRIAVFNKGRIEQIGQPRRGLRASGHAFVAGFVGVSNILSGAAAAAIPGAPPAFSIRPEKIVMAPPGTSAPRRCLRRRRHHHQRALSGRQHPLPCGAAGGGELTVIEQNREETASSALGPQGQPVRLIWQRSHIQEMRPEPRRARPPRSAGPPDAPLHFPLSAAAAGAAPAAAAAAAVAGHCLSGLAAGAAGAELLLDRRFLRPDGLSADADDLCRALHRRPISPSSCARW